MQKLFKNTTQTYIFLGAIVLTIGIIFRALMRKKLGLVKEDPLTDAELMQDRSLWNRHSVSGDSVKTKYKNIAQSLAHHLGTAYALYDPKRWSENDKEAFNILNTIDSLRDFDLISEIYTRYTNEKNGVLSADLLRLLDSKYYSQLTYK